MRTEVVLLVSEISFAVVQGTGLDVPIKAESDVINLKTCLFGATHREQVHTCVWAMGSILIPVLT
jgi:hypothetical protein